MDLPDLSRKEQKLANRLFKPKPIQRKDDVSVFGALKMTWYFEGFWSKFFLAIATYSLIYSIIRIIFQGFW